MRPYAPLLALFVVACGDGADPSSLGSRSSDPTSETAPAGAQTAPPSTNDTPPTSPADPAPATDPPKDPSTTPPAKSYAQGPSAGCSKPTGAKGLQTKTMTIAGKTRDYLRFIPAGYTPGKAVKLVLGFHGSGGTDTKARDMFALEANAGNDAIFIYPQGLPDPAFGGDNRWDPTMGSDDYTFVDALITEAETNYCIDRDHVFAVGFSNGARFTSMLGCYRGDKLRAIAPVAPGGDNNTLPLDKGQCVGEVSIWEGVGTEDPDHIPGAELVRDHYRMANGCATTKTATTPAGCDSYDACRSPLKSTYCTYPGGHAWPPIGTNAVWSFFSKT